MVHMMPHVVCKKGRRKLLPALVVLYPARVEASGIYLFSILKRSLKLTQAASQRRKHTYSNKEWHATPEGYEGM